MKNIIKEIIISIFIILIFAGLAFIYMKNSHYITDKFHNITDVISQELITENNLTVKDMTVTNSNLYTNIGTVDIFDSKSIKNSDIKGSIDIEYTLGDDSKFTKTINIEDIDNIPDIGSTISTQYYKGIYLTANGLKQTVKSQNKFQKGDNINTDIINPEYKWEKIIPRKDPIKTNIIVTYSRSNGKTHKIDTVTTDYTIQP
jgi:hypothetical protein